MWLSFERTFYTKFIESAIQYSILVNNDFIIKNDCFKLPLDNKLEIIFYQFSFVIIYPIPSRQLTSI